MSLFPRVIAACPKCNREQVLSGEAAESQGMVPVWLCQCPGCLHTFRVAVVVEITDWPVKRPAEYKPLRLAE